MPQQLQLNATSRYQALDAIRGVAAVCVMLFHFTQHNGLKWFNGAWAAVDLFFILSGFVIMFSYGEKISNGMNLVAFLRIRLIRLWPLFAVGMVIGLIAMWVHIAGQQLRNAPIQSLAGATMLNAFFLPYLNEIRWSFCELGKEYFVAGLLFPVNISAWSIFYELSVNVFFFLILRFAKNIPIWLFVLPLFLLVIGITCLFHVKNPGWETKTFLMGFPRASYQFFLGMLIFRYKAWFNIKTKIPSIFLAILTLLCYIHGTGVSFANSILIAPLLVAFASAQRFGNSGKKIGAFLGAISYPLYIIHYPVYRLVNELYNFSTWNPVVLVLAISILSIVAACCLVPLDKHIRRHLLKITADKHVMSVGNSTR